MEMADEEAQTPFIPKDLAEENPEGKKMLGSILMDYFCITLNIASTVVLVFLNKQWVILTSLYYKVLSR